MTQSLDKQNVQTCAHSPNWTWTQLSVCLNQTFQANANKYLLSCPEVSSYPALAHTHTYIHNIPHPKKGPHGYCNAV